MSTDLMVKKLNKEVKILRRDVINLKAVLLGAFVISAESIKEYKNTDRIKRAFRKALISHPAP